MQKKYNYEDLKNEFKELERKDDVWGKKPEKLKYWKNLFARIPYTINPDGTVHTYESAKKNYKLNRKPSHPQNDMYRVSLNTLVDGTNYINAGLIKPSFIDLEYICTQAPLKQTIKHFWQMVWEQNSRVIFMLTAKSVDNISLCEVYFPQKLNEKLNFGNFNITCTKISRFMNQYLTRTLSVLNEEEKTTREITHYYYFSWEYYKPLNTPEFLLKLIKDWRNPHINSKDFGPPIIHSSHGCGRAGVFILIDVLQQTLKLNDGYLPYTIPETLKMLRLQRSHLVLTPAQLRFVYQTILHLCEFYYKKRQEISIQPNRLGDQNSGELLLRRFNLKSRFNAVPDSSRQNLYDDLNFSDDDDEKPFSPAHTQAKKFKLN